MFADLEKMKEALGENQFKKVGRAARDVLELGYDTYSAAEKHLASEGVVIRYIAIVESDEFASHEVGATD